MIKNSIIIIIIIIINRNRVKKWELSVNKWSDVKCIDVEWTDLIYV